MVRDEWERRQTKAKQSNPDRTSRPMEEVWERPFAQKEIYINSMLFAKMILVSPTEEHVFFFTSLSKEITHTGTA